MFKQIVNSYYKLFDEKVKNGTLVVFLVTLLIIAIWFCAKKDETMKHIKVSLYENKL